MTYLRKVLEVLTNCAILVVSGLICWSFFTHKVPFTFSSGAAIEAKLEGSVLAPAGYNWSLHPKTLVLAIRKDCHFCEDSLPFYKKLSDLEKENSLRTHVLIVMPDDSLSGTALLKREGISMESIFNLPLNSMHVSGTPTILLVDSRGQVIKTWVGELSSQREQEVLSNITS